MRFFKVKKKLTLFTPASTSSLAHGGVLPWCAHGSKVTYAVPPRALWPAARSAKTSACGLPACGWSPSPTTISFSPSSPLATITQPTAGFGSVCPIPRLARSRARRMWARSAAVMIGEDEEEEEEVKVESEGSAAAEATTTTIEGECRRCRRSAAAFDPSCLAGA